MLKTITSLMIASSIAITFSACGAEPTPKSEPDLTSTKKEKAMWQQFQNSKAQKSLDKEFQ